MKTQKKWIKSMLSIIMAGIMLFGMTLTTLAAGELETRAAETGTVTINNTVAGKGLNILSDFRCNKKRNSSCIYAESGIRRIFYIK